MPDDPQPPREPPQNLTDYRLQEVEHLVRAFGPAVTRIEVVGVRLEEIAEDLERERAARSKLWGAVDELRRDLRDDRKESRNRTLLALAPISLAALGLLAKVVLGVDLPGGS